MIGPIGTVTRVILGSALLGAVTWGELRAGTPAGLALGLAGFPAVVLAAPWWRARRDPAPLQATGPVYRKPEALHRGIMSKRASAVSPTRVG